MYLYDLDSVSECYSHPVFGLDNSTYFYFTINLNLFVIIIHTLDMLLITSIHN